MIYELIKFILICIVLIFSFNIGLNFRRYSLFLVMKIIRIFKTKKAIYNNYNCNIKEVNKNKIDNNEEYNILQEEDITDENNTYLTDLKKQELCQLFFIRSDLNMGAGKIAAQVAHSSINIFSYVLWESKSYERLIYQAWLSNRDCKKVLYKVDNLNTLNTIKKKLKELNVYSRVICDAGLTQIKAGSATVLGTLPVNIQTIDLLVSNNSSITNYIANQEDKECVKAKKEKNNKDINKKNKKSNNLIENN